MGAPLLAAFARSGDFLSQGKVTLLFVVAHTRVSVVWFKLTTNDE